MSPMKIALLTAPLEISRDRAALARLDDGDNTLVPIGLYSLAALLMAQGHEVHLLNHTLQTWEESLAEVQALAPGLVGLTCMTHQRLVVDAWGRAMRQRLPGARFIVGGVHPTFLWEQVLRRWEWADFVAVGEAEASLPELIARLERGESAQGVAGIAMRGEQGQPVFAGAAAPFCALGELPIPAEHFAYDVVSTARGCPFECSFCCSPGIWGRRVRERPVDHVVRELTLLRRRHGVRQIHFKDETFTLKKSRVIELCQAIIEAGLDIWWTCDTRVDCLDEERLAWMRRAGCFYVSFGIESGSPRMLKSINKRIDLDKIRTATELARRYGMLVRYYLIAGLEGETNEDLAATLRVIEDNRPNFVFLCDLSVSPGTPVFENYARLHGVDESVWFEAGRPVVLPFDPAHRWRTTQAGRALMKYYNSGGKAEDRTMLHPLSEDELRGARDLVPEAFAAHYDLALVLKAQERWAEAAEVYRAALALRPAAGKARLDLAECLDRMGQLPQAVEQWEAVEREARDEDPKNLALALVCRGLAARAGGDLTAAAGLWERAHALVPGSTQPLSLLAEAYAGLGRWTEVEEKATLWMRLDPGSGQAVHLMALVYMMQGAAQDAKTLFDRALQLAPGNADIYANYAALLLRAGHPGPAAELLAQALKLNPAHTAARQMLEALQSAPPGR